MTKFWLEHDQIFFTTYYFCAYAREAPEYCIGVGSEGDLTCDGCCHRSCYVEYTVQMASQQVNYILYSILFYSIDHDNADYENLIHENQI